MSTYSLPELLKSAGQRMRVELAERLIPHRGELGAAREEIIRDFLRHYLPKRFEVSTGFVFDCHGHVSQQMDIVIANSLVCPRFEAAGGVRFYPIESVVAVGQIKSVMTSCEELTSALENIASVKSLDRSANGTAFDRAFQEHLDHTSHHLHQVFGFIFVVGKALSESTAHEFLMDYLLTKPIHTWPNIVLALDQYLVTYHCDDGICPNPMHARAVALQPASPDMELLMKFYLFTAGAIEVTRVSSFPYWKHFHSVNNWTGRSYYACTDDPPPYLGSLTTG